MNKVKPWLTRNLSLVAWLLGGFVSFVSFYVWLSNLGKFNIYSLFPLLGLLAFSLMWTHYILHALKIYLKIKGTTYPNYRNFTNKFVLALLLLHPGLFIYKLFVDGYGLPPKSYSGYVAPAMVGFVILGMVALFIFLLYELKSKLEAKAWWKYILIANAVAMFAILIHSLKLGQNLQSGMLKYTWVFYGISLLISYAYLIKEKSLY